MWVCQELVQAPSHCQGSLYLQKSVRQWKQCHWMRTFPDACVHTQRLSTCTEFLILEINYKVGSSSKAKESPGMSIQGSQGARTAHSSHKYKRPAGHMLQFQTEVPWQLGLPTMQSEMSTSRDDRWYLRPPQPCSQCAVSRAHLAASLD